MAAREAGQARGGDTEAEAGGWDDSYLGEEMWNGSAAKVMVILSMDLGRYAYGPLVCSKKGESSNTG